MDISSTSAIPGYAYAASSTKVDTSLGIAMLNKVNKMQADAAKQMIQSVAATTPVQGAPRVDGTGLYINVSA